jgi:secondary thiamine-phosphate synthase enzyme
LFAEKEDCVNSYRKEVWFETPGRRAFLNVTPQVEAALKESGVREGLALINAMHITASVFINDDESGLHADYDAWLERLAPHEPVSGYRHNLTGEDNADAHLKRQIMGAGGRGSDYSWQTRLRSLGADFLWRVRRRSPQARTDQDHRRIVENGPSPRHLHCQRWGSTFEE